MCAIADAITTTPYVGSFVRVYNARIFFRFLFI